jgi:hypothetical protein
MERMKAGVMFWVLLLVSVAMPASAQKVVKKQLYQATIAVDTMGKGSSTILVSTSSPEYLVRTYSYPDQSVTRVALAPVDNAWELVLCDNSGAEACTYGADGNLDLEGFIVGPMFPPGLTGAIFFQTLQDGNLTVQLNGGVLGSGTYIRIL